MLHRVAHIATLLVSGVASGVCIGAVVTGVMPIWLGITVVLAVATITIGGAFDQSTSDDPRD